MSVTEKALASWYKTQEGARVVALEQLLLARIVDHFRPYRCLEFAQVPLIDSNLIVQKINVSMHFNKRIAQKSTCVAGDPGCLPFVSEYFDLIVCCHVHEMGQAHGKIIAEFSRVLSPGGMIVLIGVNPYGIWRALHASAIKSWWKHPIAPSKILELADMCALAEVYTDYSGFFQVGGTADKGWEKQFSTVMGNYAPGLSALYKLVLRKNIGAASGLIDTSAMQAAIPG